MGRLTTVSAGLGEVTTAANGPYISLLPILTCQEFVQMVTKGSFLRPSQKKGRGAGHVRGKTKVSAARPRIQGLSRERNNPEGVRVHTMCMRLVAIFV